MGSYLEAYGAEEAQRAQRARILKRLIIAGVIVILGGLILYGAFRNYSEESTVRHFLGLLRTQQYQDAYRMFGCTEATPCPNYSFPKFMEDWGPKSPFGDASKTGTGVVQTCGNGVLVQVTYPGKEPTALVVERANEQISFAPWPECPGRHWHFRQWWDSLSHKQSS